MAPVKNSKIVSTKSKHSETKLGRDLKNGNIESSSRDVKKRDSSKKKYDFVLNNYDSLAPTYIEDLTLKLNQYCKRWLFGYEVGESGTPHLQGYLELKVKDRMEGILHKICDKFSLRECRNEEALLKYCVKDGKVESYGFPKAIKIIDKLRDWQKVVEKICIDEPDGRSINWIYDKIGGSGKSMFCKYMYVKHKAIVIQGGKLSDIVNIIFNTNMDDVNCIVIDIPRCTKNKVSYSAIECILNGMITNTKYETGIKVFNSVNVVVMSNFEPELEKLSLDRWKVFKIEDNAIVSVDVNDDEVNEYV